MRRILTWLAAAVMVVAANVVAAPSASAATYTPPALRQRVDLNSGWRFNKGDVAGAEATTFNDSAWQRRQFRTPGTPWTVRTAATTTTAASAGTAATTPPPAAYAGKMLFLQFAGANQVADVWVNGTYLGTALRRLLPLPLRRHRGAPLGQDNVIAVKVTNASHPTSRRCRADYTFHGGIYRNVSLWSSTPCAVRMLDFAGPGVYLRQRSRHRRVARPST